MNKHFNYKVGWKTFWKALRVGDLATAARIGRMAFARVALEKRPGYAKPASGAV